MQSIKEILRVTEDAVFQVFTAIQQISVSETYYAIHLKAINFIQWIVLSTF